MNIDITGISYRNHPLHYLSNAYHCAKYRCTNQNHPQFKDWGGRGIEFRFASIEEFINELGERPTPEHSVDRIDGNRNYEIGNVRWASKTEQSVNRRKQTNNKSGFIGVSYFQRDKKWKALVRKDRKQHYCGLFSTAIEAAKARDLKALELYGPDAKLNFQ
jgi:hypothetical protein